MEKVILTRENFCKLIPMNNLKENIIYLLTQTLHRGGIRVISVTGNLLERYIEEGEYIYRIDNQENQYKFQLKTILEPLPITMEDLIRIEDEIRKHRR